MYPIVRSPSLTNESADPFNWPPWTNCSPIKEVEAVCRDLGYTWRNRQLPPGPTVRSMVYRGLHPDHSIAAVLADLAALLGPDGSAPSDSAWCQAATACPKSPWSS